MPNPLRILLPCVICVLCVDTNASLSAQNPARPKITGIIHVDLSSTNMPQARTFYAKVLDPSASCLMCEEHAMEPFFVRFLSGQRIMIHPAHVGLPSSSFLTGIAFQTDNLKAMRRYLTDQKIRVISSKGDEGRLAVLDPEGHPIWFWQMVDFTKPSDNSLALRIIHAGFIVRDRAATEHFYKDILGFRPYWHGGMKDDQTDWVSMQVPNGTDWLEFMVSVEPDANQRLRGIMNHIAIGVTDVHATQKKLLDAGVKLTEEPKIGRDGKWQLNLYDPDDTRVEFMEFTPVQKPCCSEFTGPHPGPESPSKAPSKP